MRLKLPRYDKALTFRISQEQYRKLTELAKSHSLTQSEIIRHLIELAFKQNRKRKG